MFIATQKHIILKEFQSATGINQYANAFLTRIDDKKKIKIILSIFKNDGYLHYARFINMYVCTHDLPI